MKETNKVKAVDQVSRRLRILGFKNEAEAIEDISYWVELIYDEVITNLCRNEIPQPLWRVYIDMVCGRYLEELYNLGNLEYKLSPELTPKDFSSIHVGDVSVGLNVKGLSERSRLLTLIGDLKEPPGCWHLFDYYRDFLK